MRLDEDAGDADGEAMLGAALHLGMGTARDPVAAYVHLKRAESRGSALAAPFLHEAWNALDEDQRREAETRLGDPT